MSHFAGWSLGLPVTSISQGVPGMWWDGGESAWTLRVSGEFCSSRDPFWRWLQFSAVQNDPSARGHGAAFGCRAGAGGWRGLKSTSQTSIIILD